jgi:DTW domain-containing protein YfiP
MSNDDSTFYRWITRSCFRNCSTCRSCSKAGLCPCTRRVISKHAEPTFELLRYDLGGNRPSQTDPLTRSQAGKPDLVRQPIT